MYLARQRLAGRDIDRGIVFGVAEPALGLRMGLKEHLGEAPHLGGQEAGTGGLAGGG